MTKEKYKTMKINKIDSEKILSNFCQIFCQAFFLTKNHETNLTKLIINELTQFWHFFEKFSVKTENGVLTDFDKFKTLIFNKLNVEMSENHFVKIFSNSAAQVDLSGKIGKIFQKSGKFSTVKMSLLNEKNFKNFAR